jgi:hypothetical protein
MTQPLILRCNRIDALIALVSRWLARRPGGSCSPRRFHSIDIGNIHGYEWALALPPRPFTSVRAGGRKLPFLSLIAVSRSVRVKQPDDREPLSTSQPHARSRQACAKASKSDL